MADVLESARELRIPAVGQELDVVAKLKEEHPAVIVGLLCCRVDSMHIIVTACIDHILNADTVCFCDFIDPRTVLVLPKPLVATVIRKVHPDAAPAALRPMLDTTNVRRSLRTVSPPSDGIRNAMVHFAVELKKSGRLGVVIDDFLEKRRRDLDSALEKRKGDLDSALEKRNWRGSATCCDMSHWGWAGPCPPSRDARCDALSATASLQTFFAWPGASPSARAPHASASVQ
eukprot:CAMPEP_0179261484 /NCGR_PEP_ID=MMETSP0797-20121207/26887_1 /TAXON_ID=47934 /ORGANISM="Dinophysis acuminata, Strain DAEP01" /LENGTH=230 /DNA_ID=CAMNT_0020969613 /DNA_START=314 /DNA_END=1004 /DNA_ORIENTATION=-